MPAEPQPPAGPGRLPPGATDTHAHVFDPLRHAYAADRRYTPPSATQEDLVQRQAALGIERVVLVQPSVYGVDNACLLEAIDAIGIGRCRGVAVLDLGRARPADLAELHRRGVRGARLNFEVRHEADPANVRAELLQAATVVTDPGWSVHLHGAASLLDTVHQTLPRFAVPLVLDHFGGLSAADADPHSPALQALLRLLATGRVYVKLSAFYRASAQAPHHADLRPLVRTVIAARPDRVLWGSDWPHTGGRRERDPAHIEPFRQVDLGASLEALADWAGDARTLERILVDNPAALFGFGSAAQGVDGDLG